MLPHRRLTGFKRSVLGRWLNSLDYKYSPQCAFFVQPQSKGVPERLGNSRVCCPRRIALGAGAQCRNQRNGIEGHVNGVRAVKPGLVPHGPERLHRNIRGKVGHAPDGPAHSFIARADRTEFFTGGGDGAIEVENAPYARFRAPDETWAQPISSSASQHQAISHLALDAYLQLKSIHEQRLQHLTGDVVVENYPLRSLGRDDKVLPKECLRAALDSLALEFVCVAAAPGEEKDCGIRLGVYWG